MLVGVAHEAERREPLVALVMRRLDAADGLLLAAREVQPGPQIMSSPSWIGRPCATQVAWKARTTSSRIFSPFSVTIAFSPYCAIMSIVRPLAIGIQISTGRCFGRGTTVMSCSR